ncbi:MAG: DUF3800 domain-containing protein [Pseudomonadales bacterium]|nr:DUF3800 domain-containing protein [Pseudomonadales bacterium]
MINDYSDYIVYVDESGDHSLHNVDPNYPIFVLAFCIFQKKHYSEKIVPALQKFKFKHFGHDLVILHEQEIRKEKGDFNIFKGRDERENFIKELTEIIEQHNFILTCCVIKKENILTRYPDVENPYHLALRLGLERLFAFLKEKSQEKQLTHIVVERRGKKEDNELELEFRRICDGENAFKQRLPLDIKFGDKRVNSAGLQLADLIARPVGLKVLRPQQSNRAFDVLIPKFLCRGGRNKVGVDFEELGLKVFPD